MNCSECGSNHGKKPKIECTGSCTRADAMRAAVESRGFGESNWNSFPPLSPVLSFTLHDCTTARLQNCTTAQTEKPSLTDPRCLQKRNRRPEASSASTAVGGAARQHGPASAAGCPAVQNGLCAAELAEVAALTTRSAHTMKKKEEPAARRLEKERSRYAPVPRGGKQGQASKQIEEAWRARSERGEMERGRGKPNEHNSSAAGCTARPSHKIG